MFFLASFLSNCSVPEKPQSTELTVEQACSSENPALQDYCHLQMAQCAFHIDGYTWRCEQIQSSGLREHCLQQISRPWLHPEGLAYPPDSDWNFRPPVTPLLVEPPPREPRAPRAEAPKTARQPSSSPSVMDLPAARAPQKVVTLDIRGEGHEARITTVIHGKKGQLNYCYERSLLKNPQIRGLAWFELPIRDGQAREAQVSGELPHELLDCFARKVRSWKFPADASTDISFSAVFTVN